MTCAALACGKSAKGTFCAPHMRKLKKLGVDPAPTRDAAVALAREEGFLAPDPLQKRAKIEHRTEDADADYLR